MLQRHRNILFSTAIVALTFAPDLIAGNLAEIQDHLSADVIGVVYINLDKMDLRAVLEQFGPSMVQMLKSDTRLRHVVAGQEEVTGQLRDLGVGSIYILLRVNDFSRNNGPTWIAPIRQRSPQVIAALEKLISQVPSSSPQLLPRHVALIGDSIVGSPSREVLDDLKARRKGRAEIRPEVREAITQIGGGILGIAIFGDADSRRVIGELFPSLPPPFASIDGPFIANQIRWISVSIHTQPNHHTQLIVQMREAKGTETASAAMTHGLQLGKQAVQHQLASTPNIGADVDGFFAQLHPRVDGARASLTIETKLFAAVGNLISGPLQMAQQTFFQQARINQFKQIGLAIWNYESANRSFPAAAIYSKERPNQPLLSWRVAILPYLGETALFEKFRLNEPWDSEHNRQLIPQIPQVFVDPDPAILKALALQGEGRTTYVVPAGERTVFRSPTGMALKEITDGTSRTVLALEIVPERSVVWTEPHDWTPDANDPLAGVRRTDGRSATVVRVDGSVHILTEGIDAEKWSAMLTPDGNDFFPED